jgi:hypothetical protein
MTAKRGPVGSEACAAVCDCAGLRCECGSLLARYVGGRVELKCRRCKRTLFLTIQHADVKPP